MDKKEIYFPPLYGKVDCSKCDIKDECLSAGKFQRNKRDFSYTSGRCPRLPDLRGFVEKEWRAAYAAAFPIIHAELGAGDTLNLTLAIPNEAKWRRVYRSKSGTWWYFKQKDEYGSIVNQAIRIEGGMQSEKEVIDRIKALHTDYCIFRCEILGFTV